MLFSVLLPLSFFFFVLFIAAAAVFAFFFGFLSDTVAHLSIDVVVFESSSSLSFQVFVFSCVVIVVVFFTSHACWKVTVNFLELVPAASFTCASVASLIFLCRCVHLITRSSSFISSFCPISRLLRVVAVSFF